MTMPPAGIGEQIVKFVGAAIKRSEASLDAATIVAVSFAKSFLRYLLPDGVISDIDRMKESLLRKMDAEAAKEEAEAQNRLAEAAEAANHATLHKRKDAFAAAERRKLEAEADKVEAEGEAVLMDAETRRLQAMADSRIRLIEAVSRLRQEGGDVLVSRENLESIVRNGLLSFDPERQGDP
jgi:hypothetical protein